MKQRNVFALRNFRGLDKENKLLKVQPYRATDGYNFYIDSETLKTRPSFSPLINPSFYLESGDYLIDWYNYGGIYIYVTKKHIYVNDGEITFNETSNANNVYRSSFQNTLNFEGLKPLFQEEKECLFIFCLNQIYVFSVIDTNYVLYALDEKPTNPFENASDNWNTFEDLPTPYVPTILLGNNAFDDPNLLSKKSKYKLFANQPSNQGYVTYNLPTYYDKDKHGDFEKEDISIEFYGNQFEGFEALPNYMGSYQEDWFGTITGTTMGDYGALINEGANIVVDQIYFAPKDLEYLGTHDSGEVIDERIYLDRNTFYNLTIGDETVFEFLMNYIKTNTITANSVLVFNVLVQATAIHKDNQGTVTERHNHQDVRQIYVQLKKYENENLVMSDEVVTSNDEFVLSTDTEYPTYPTYTAVGDDYEAELNGGNPILVSSTTDFVEKAKELALSNLNSNIDSLVDGSTAYIEMKLFKTTTQAEPRVAIMPELEEDVFEFASYIQPTNTGAYPSYPTIANPLSYDVVDLPYMDLIESAITTSDFSPTSTETTKFKAAIDLWIRQNGVADETNYIIFRIRGYKRIYTEDEGALVLGYEYVSATAKIFITPAIVEYEERRSILYEATINVDQVDITEPNVLYKIELKNDKTTIQLKTADYFFDYKNEPTFEVTVTFRENKEYNYIANSKFGTTFGSENRLFLAGNSEFPNIDRYNVSNDLLGDNVKSQSYELTYFPSKNYRVLGGKGAINGYVITADNQMYITKEAYPNDSKLFIRQRSVSEQGLVLYFESKTNITKTPINNRCIVRFFNDILILAKDGLYGIELSQNILTDERLVKLRSGFINKDIIAAIENETNKSEIFILENNVYMYIFIGDKCYVADSRYVGQASNSSIENISYEIIEWQTPINFFGGKIDDDKLYLIERDSNFVYTLAENRDDRQAFKDDSAIYNYSDASQGSYMSTNSYSFDTSRLGDYVFKLKQGYERIADRTTDYTYSIDGDVITITLVSGTSSFSSIKDGDFLYFNNYSNPEPLVFVQTNNFSKYQVSNFESNNYESLTLTRVSGTQVTSNGFDIQAIFVNIANVDLYITKAKSGTSPLQFYLSFRKPTSVVYASTLTTTNKDGIHNIGDEHDLYMELRTIINMRWISAITDFGNSQMEKTSFTLNIYATKADETNTIDFGYRTMRRLAGFNETIDLSNNFNLQEVEFSQFALSTFNTSALSRPMKENNFLYIQFTLNGYGKIEINAIEVLYKANRMVKSIG